jgi:hypothetical protein
MSDAPNSTDPYTCVVEHVKKGERSPTAVSKACGIPASTASVYIRRALKMLGIEEKKEEKKEERREGSTRAAGMAQTMRTADQMAADVFRAIAEKVAWWSEALVNIGWLATLAAFQYARIDPKDIPQKVSELASADEFVGFVSSYLFAMIQASGDAVNAIVERDERIRKLENVLKVVAVTYQQMKRNIRELTRRYEIAVGILSRYGLIDEYTDAIMRYSIAETILTAPAEVPAVPEQGGEKGG